MSMNINVTLPLDVVAAMQDLPDEPSGDEVKATVTLATAQAIVAGVKTLPFSIAAKSTAGERKRKHVEDTIPVPIMDAYGNMMRISLDSDATVNLLKNSIWTRCGIPQGEQRLELKSKVLDGDMTLRECNIDEINSEIYLSTDKYHRLLPTNKNSRA
ncbi:hypothetical protein KC318_g3429 [Hortaea werneckii]|nr:hypothetical protein KC334_g3895 [Hortaea werneckii]KAI7014471.1 hypothetical protein KC355_g4680 [Hortaea werneckii]KAI7671547.1 hypothetical protein KC318_g3429 [Hortaea werneckii]